MAFTISNFVIDRILRGAMFHSSTQEMLFSINQITNPTLTVSSDTTDAVDALGTPIVTFNRAKQAEFSAENSLFDLNLLAAQSGSTVDVATNTNRYNVPIFDEIRVSTADTLTLSHTPATVDSASTLKFLYKLNGDGTTGTKYTVGTTASGTTVTLSTATVTFATGQAAVGDRFFAFYEYEASDASGNGAVRVTADAVNFPTAGRFIMEVLGVDVCDPSTLYHAYIEFGNAKLLSDFDITFATDSTHPFSMRANQDYCDPEKRLFRIVIPEIGVAA